MGGGVCNNATARRRAVPCVLLGLSAFFAACTTSLPPTSHAPVAIVVSDRLGAYQQVADALRNRLSPAPSIYTLDGDAQRAAQVLAKLREQNTPVVAIGTLATRTVSVLSNRTVIYCQDLAADETRASLRGVKPIPPAYKQLQAWRMVDPRLQRVVLVRGAANGDFVREAQAAAQLLKIRLDVVDAQTDREVLYAVKHLEGDVQGIWFVPDNRVLSTEVLREALAHGLRQGKQHLVFSSQLLGFGALLSVEGDPSDVAERVVDQLRQSDSPRVASLVRARTTINLEVAKQLGLNVPVPMQAGTYVF